MKLIDLISAIGGDPESEDRLRCNSDDRRTL